MSRTASSWSVFNERQQFLDALVHQVIVCEVSCLVPYLSVALRELRCSDVATCRLLLGQALDHANEAVRGSALHGIAFGKGVPTQLDIAMLAQGFEDPSHRVRRTVIDGLRFAAKAPELEAVAIDWVTRISPNRDRRSAEWWCGTLAPHVQELSAAQVARVLAELEHIDVLDDYHVGELLQGLASSHPGAVATLMVKRLDIFRQMVDDRSYGYRPVPTFMRHKLHMAASSAIELLKVLRDAIPASAARMKQELTAMFWTLGGPSSEALSLVDEWLHSEELGVVRASLDILAEAPYRLCLDRPAFAGHVVAVCRRLGEGDLALQTVVNNCTPNVWSRTIGSAPTEHSEVILEARRLAELWSDTFVGEALANVALDIEKRSEAIRNEDAF